MTNYAYLGLVSTDELISRARNSGVFTFDLETTGVNPRTDKIEGISFYIPGIGREKPLRAWYPFVDRTIEVKKYKCSDCYWESYEDSDCEVDKASVVLTYKCPDCNVKLDATIENLRPPMDQFKVMTDLKALFDDESLICVGHNLKLDMSFLMSNPGIDEPISVKCKIADSMIAHYIQDETLRRYGLKPSVKRVFDYDMTSYKDATSNDGMFSFAMTKPLGVYAQDDAEWTYKLYEWSLKSMENQDESGRLMKIFWDLEMKITRIIMEMEQTGVKIDWEWLLEVSADLEKKKGECLATITELAGRSINLNSQQQVSNFMFNSPANGGLGLSTQGLEEGKSGYYPTGDKIIKFFARKIPAIDEISKYRSLDTVQKGFADKLVKLAKVDGRVYSRFNQTGTKIGRLSSSDPVNFQNQPRDKNLIRKAFCSRLPNDFESDMEFFGADFSQIELRVVAHLAGEEDMKAVYLADGVCTYGIVSGGCDSYEMLHSCENKLDLVPPCKWEGFIAQGSKCPECGSELEWLKRCRHVDLHQRTAEDADVPRNPLAKNLNFGCLYRIGPRRFVDYADLYTKNGDPKLDEARDLINRFYTAYPYIPIFHNRVEHEVKANGWIAYTLTRRRRRLYESMKRFGEYKAVTQAVQFAVSGTAQDIMKVSMIRLWEGVQKKINNSAPALAKQWRRVKFLLQVHDEIILQGPSCIGNEIKALIKDSMENAANLSVPLRVDVKSGTNWDHVH